MSGAQFAVVVGSMLYSGADVGVGGLMITGRRIATRLLGFASRDIGWMEDGAEPMQSKKYRISCTSWDILVMMLGSV